MNFLDKDLISIQEARALISNALDTQFTLCELNQTNYDQLLEKVYTALKKKVYEISSFYVEETGYGIKQDEEKIVSMLMDKLYKALKPLKCNGLIRQDIQNKTLDIAVSRGLVLLIVSPVSTVSSIITAVFNCIKSGSTLIIAPDKRVVNTTSKIVDIINEELRSFGFNNQIVSNLRTVADKGVKELLESEDISTIINQGQKEYIEDCKKSAKLFIYAAGGASPVFIEKSANVPKAVEDIMQSRSFNNAILPGSEQYVIVNVNRAKEVKHCMEQNGAYFMSRTEDEKLQKLIIKDGKMDREYIGKDARTLASLAGFEVAKDTKVLVSENEYIAEVNPYITEIIAPVLAFYVEPDWINACEKCINLLKGTGRGHCLVIHSNDNEIIREFAMKKPVGRFLINTKASFGAMGINNNLFPSAILGGFTCNIGSISGNLNPDILIYKRNAAYENNTTIGENYKNFDLPSMQNEVKTIDNDKKNMDFESLISKLGNLINNI